MNDSKKTSELLREIRNMESHLAHKKSDLAAAMGMERPPGFQSTEVEIVTGTLERLIGRLLCVHGDAVREVSTVLGEHMADRLVRGARKERAGVDRIAAERQRQIEQEGFDAERDDGYTDGSLARAAAHYASPGDALLVEGIGVNKNMWPPAWDSVWDKKDRFDRKRQLAVAGALIAAELDRLIRAG